MDAAQLAEIAIIAVPVIIAITFHEAAHGWVAWRLGDDTAHRLGRVTFNPLKHIDVFGTLLLPAAMYFSTGFLFGWAKPVPVVFSRLNRPRSGMVWVALAGPGINLALAFMSAWLMRWTPVVPEPVGEWVLSALEYSLIINVVLAVFNMVPLPPLDGGRVAVGLLPDVLARPLAGLERWGLFILIGVLFILPLVGGKLGYHVNPLSWLLGPPVEAVIHTIVRLAGLA